MTFSPSTCSSTRDTGIAAALALAAITLGCSGPKVASQTAPAATTAPAAADPIVKADVVRGGQLYDTWWKVAGVLGAAEPTETNPDYAKTQGKKSGAATYRCKECHGWDYKGRDGAYGSGKSFTGVPGLMRAHTAASPVEIHRVLREGSADGTHKVYAAHLSETDTWDLVKFIREGIVDLGPHIAAATKTPVAADKAAGQSRYTTCAGCHGADGKTDNFGTADAPEYVGTVAISNPWELVHKVRFGQPGTKMPSAVRSGWTMKDVIDVLAHTQSLPGK